MEEFSIEKKIYYHDTDCGGVVYYANYLKFLEEGRTEFCADRGISLKELADKGAVFPVVHVEVNYKSPARYQDIIRIHTKVAKVGNSSVHYDQKITRDGVLLVEAKTVWACVGNDFKIRPVPVDLKRAITD
ncbi:MAG: thioesterase family protein [Candidatus Omnitrophica bacterium]|nr:thioesterase family protein [Candidatus Omnitrophota bacterium]